MGKRRKKKYRGHFCWSCERILPNEKFSGKGHARHVCKVCSRLGKEELDFRSAARNMHRCFTLSGYLRKKKRKQFEVFLKSSNPRVLKYAQELLEYDREMRNEDRLIREEEAFWEYKQAAADEEFWKNEDVLEMQYWKNKQAAADEAFQKNEDVAEMQYWQNRERETCPAVPEDLFILMVREVDS